MATKTYELETPEQATECTREALLLAKNIVENLGHGDAMTGHDLLQAHEDSVELHRMLVAMKRYWG